MLSDAQRQARAQRVGASEVSALLDPNPHRFTEPFHIYDRIVHGSHWEAEPGHPAWVGQQLEPVLLKMAREAWGLKARLTSRPAVHPSLPLSASADGLSADYLTEVKVTSVWGYQTGDIPQYVLDQVTVQCGLYRKPLAYVVVLNGSRFWHAPVPFMADRYAELCAAVEKFDTDFLTPRRRPPQPKAFRGRKTA